MAITSPTKFGDYAHQSTGITKVSRKVGTNWFLATLPMGAVAGATPTIVNVAVTTDAWTALATGLTNVVAWRISEASGDNLQVAFTAAPATFFTIFGWHSEVMPLTDIYVKRIAGSETRNAQLLYWSL